jgi:7,8-dihydroneopterin aldolase/epimerase/oxygenase
MPKPDVPRRRMAVTSGDHVRVRLRNVTVEARCGVHPWERHPERPNKLTINIDLYAPLRNGPMEPQGYIDYDHIRDFLKSFPKRPHTELLETLVDEIVGQCFLCDRVDSCRVSILKQDIFNEAEGAGIEAFRTREAWEGSE